MVQVVDSAARRRRPSTSKPSPASRGDDAVDHVVYVCNVPQAGTGARATGDTGPKEGEEDDVEDVHPWVLSHRVTVSHDSVVIRLVRSSKDGTSPVSAPAHVVDMDCWHVSVGATLEGRPVPVVRDYTPISTIAQFNAGVLVRSSI